MMKMYYKTCPECGAHLDPGEKCDCLKEAKKRAGYLSNNMQTTNNQPTNNKVITSKQERKCHAI